jgi:hypothetical protein
MFKRQNNKERLFVLLFLYNKNINISLATIDNEVAEYGKNFKS